MKNQKQLAGLTVSILEDKRLGNCSAGGLSATCSEATLIGDGIDEIFPAADTAHAIKLVARRIGREVVIHAEPINEPRAGNIGWMAGGSFIHSSDSRFGEAIRKLGSNGYCAISLHDRQETAEQYASNSI